MRTKASLAALALAAVAIVPNATAAQSAPPINIGVAPSKLQLRLAPGHTSHTVIKVYNKGTKPVTLDVFPQDYTISSDSTVNFKAPGSVPGSAAAWTTLSEKVLRVAPHAYGALDVTVKVPQGIPPGTHTLAVIFRSRTLSTSGGVKFQPAVASLLAAGVTKSDGTGLIFKGAAIPQSVNVHWKSLTSVRSPGDLWDALFNPTVTAQVAVVNHGNEFFNVLHGTTSFTSGLSLGGSSSDVKAPHYTILPGSVRYIEAAWSGAPFIGMTHLQTHLFYNDTTALSFSSPKNVLIIPWNLLIVLGVVLLAVVAWRLVLVRRRKSVPAETEQSARRRVIWADSK